MYKYIAGCGNGQIGGIYQLRVKIGMNLIKAVKEVVSKYKITHSVIIGSCGCL